MPVVYLMKNKQVLLIKSDLQWHAGYSEARNGAQYKERWYTTQRQHQRRDVLMPSYKHIRRCINQGCTYLPRT